MKKKFIPTSTYSNVEWALIAGWALLLASLIATVLADYDRVIGLTY